MNLFPSAKSLSAHPEFPPAIRPCCNLVPFLVFSMLAGIPSAHGAAAAPPTATPPATTATAAKTAAPAATAPAAAINPQDQVKANFIYNFAKYVEWPPTSIGPIVIGILGKNPVGLLIDSNLKSSLKNKTVNGRNIVLQTVTTSREARAVHILFVAAGEESRFEAVAASLRDVPVLLVGESEKFAQTGGMIVFTLKGDTVRFEIDLDAAEKAGLKVSSQLLSLAAAVHKKN